MSCPNKTLKEWKDLSSIYGEDLSYKLYYVNNSNIPSLEKAEELLNKRPEIKSKIYIGNVEFTPDYVKEIVDGLELYFLSDYFVKTNDFDSLFSSKLSNINDILYGKNGVFDKFYIQLGNEADPELISDLDGHEEYLTTLLFDRLRKEYGFSIQELKKKNSKNTNDDGEVSPGYGEDETINSNEEGGTRDSLSVDHAIYYNTKSGFPKAVKLLIASVAARNTDGSIKKAPNTGLPHKDYSLENLLLNNLADIPWSIEKQLKELEKYASKYPSINSLINRLGGVSLDALSIYTYNYSTLKLRQQFSQSFGKHKYDFLLTLFKGDDLIITNANQETLEKQIEKKWASNYLKIINKYNRKEYLGLLKESYSVNNPTFTTLELLGIEVTDQNLVTPGTFEYNETLQHFNVNFVNAVDNIANAIYKEYEADENKKLSDLYQRSGNVSVAIGNITRLINHVSKYELPSDLQLINGEGKTVYSINLHTYQSLISSLLNYTEDNKDESKSYEELREERIKNLKDRLPHLFNISNQNSVWLNGIVENNATIGITLVDAMGGDEIDTMHLSDIKENDMMNVITTLIINDIYPAIKHSDRGMFPAYVIKIDDLQIERLGSIERNNKNWSGNAIEKFKDIIGGYLWDEYQSYKLETDINVDHYNNNISKSYILDNINWESKNYKSIDNLKKDLKRDIDNFINNYLNKTYSEYEKYGLLQPGKKSVYDREERKYVKVDDPDKPYVGISNKDLSTIRARTGSNEKALNYIIGLAGLKYFVGSVEQFKLFLGNPAYYAIKNENLPSKSTIFDISKRSNMQSSSKNVTTVDSETNAFVKKINLEDTIFDSKSGESFVYKDGKVDGTFTELVIEDNDFISALSEQMKALYGEDSPKYKAYLKFTENDGISLVNPFFNREFQHRRGDYTEQKDKTFKKELRIINEVFSIDNVDFPEVREAVLKEIHQIPKEILEKYNYDYEKIFLEEYSPFVVEKPQYLGPNYGMPLDQYKEIPEEERISIIAGRKTSYMNLLPSMVIDTVLEDVLMFMLKNGIDVLHFNSAAKFGGIKQFDNKFRSFYKYVEIDGQVYTDGFNDTAVDPKSIGVLDFRFLGKQQEIHGEMKDEITESTQKRKIIQSGSIIDEVPVDFPGSIDDWNSLSDQEKKDTSNNYRDLREYIESQNEIVKLKLQELLDEFGYVNGKVTQPVKFINSLIRQAVDRNSPNNIIQSLENWYNSKDGLKYIETLPNYIKIQNILNSIINNNVISEKRSGTAVPQIPSTGFELKNSRRRVIDGKIESQNGLESESAVNYYTINEDGTINPAEIMIPLPTYWIGKLFNYYKNKGERIKAGDIQGLLDKVNADLASGKLKNVATYVGLRIPNQQLSSTDVLTVKKFFHPSFQSGAVVPSELVVKTGGDFDIDKLNLYFPQLDSNFESIGGENETIDDILNSSATNDIKISKLQNFNLERAKRLLLKYQPKRFLSPVDDTSLKLLRDDTRLVSVKNNPRNFIFQIDQLPKQTTEFLGGKGGTGIIATWITFNNLAQVHNIQVLPYIKEEEDSPVASVSTKLHFTKKRIDPQTGKPIEEEYGFSLGNVYTTSLEFQEQVEDVLSALLTSQVDIVKDAYATDLSITTGTLNTICYLLLRGVPVRDIITFLKEPIIADYIRERNLNESQTYKNYDLRIKKEELQEKIKLKYLTNADQQQKLDQFLTYEESAKKVNKFKAYLSADTKTLKDLNAYDLVENDLLYEIINDPIIDPSKLIDLKNNSVIGAFFDARKAINNMYNFLYLTRSKNIKRALKDIKNFYGQKEKEETKNKIYNIIDSEFINYLVQTKNSLFKDKYQSLITGNNSLAKRLIDLKKSENLKYNYLVENLVSLLDNDGQDKIKLFRNKLTTNEINQLSSFFEIIKYEDRQLYEDLIVANIFISGFYNSPYQLSKIMPYVASEEVMSVIARINPEQITEKDFEDFISKLPLVRPDILPKKKDRWKKGKYKFLLFSYYNRENKRNEIKVVDKNDGKSILLSYFKNTNYRQELSKEYKDAISEYVNYGLNYNNLTTDQEKMQSFNTDDTIDVEYTDVIDEVKALPATQPSTDVSTEAKASVEKATDHITQFKNELIDMINSSGLEGAKKINALNLVKNTKITNEKDKGKLENTICNLMGKK